MELKVTQEQLRNAAQGALDSFGAGWTTTIQSNLIVIRDKKGRVAANVNTAGVIDRKYDGRQALMGALVRDKIAAAVKSIDTILLDKQCRM